VVVKSKNAPQRKSRVGNSPVSPAERRAYRVNEFCEAYRISRDKAYDMMRTGHLRYFHVGKERRISVEAAEALATPQT
jgi:excisionase family DNA binding protein